MSKTGPTAVHANQSNIIFKFNVIPLPTKERLGDIGIYAGETNDTFHHGYIYECVEGTTYLDIIGFDPGRIGFDYAKASLEDFIDRIADILQDDTITIDRVKSGIFEYDLSMGGWHISGKDANGDTVFEDFTIYSEDLEDLGFIFLWPIEDYKDGEKMEYTLQHNAEFHFEWQRLQP